MIKDTISFRLSRINLAGINPHILFEFPTNDKYPFWNSVKAVIQEDKSISIYAVYPSSNCQKLTEYTLEDLDQIASLGYNPIKALINKYCAVDFC